MQLHKKTRMPTNRKSLTSNVLYKVSITPNEENSKTKNYYGASETLFKLRYANRKSTFNNIKYQTDTELSNKYRNSISANKTYFGKFWEPNNYTTKVLNNVSYADTETNKCWSMMTARTE